MPGQLFSQKMSQFQHTVLFSTPQKYSVCLFIYITALNSILKVWATHALYEMPYLTETRLTKIL